MHDWLFEWREPLWLLASIGVLGFLWMLRQSNRNHLQQYAQVNLLPWVIRHDSLKTSVGSAIIWLLLAYVAIVIALAGPRFYFESKANETRSGVDIVIGIDLSHSMLADSGRLPGESRYALASGFAQSLVGQLSVQDRVGLMAFAGSAHIVSPLTFDRNLWQQDLENMKPNLLPLKGSWLERAAVVASEHLFKVSVDYERPKILVMLTDGSEPFYQHVEMPRNIASLDYPQWWQSDSFSMLLLGVGSLTPTVIPSEDGSLEPLRDAGLPVYSSLQIQSLRQLAKQMKQAKVLTLSSISTSIDQVIKEIEKHRRSYDAKTSKIEWKDYGLHFVLLAMIALIMAFFAPQNKIGRWSLIFASTMVLFTLNPAVSQAAGVSANQAYKAFHQNNFTQAQDYYEQLLVKQPYQGLFGAGASAYKNKDFVAAIGFFQQAAWQAENDLNRARALFNLGNSYFKSANTVFAIQAYEQALLYQPDFLEAKNNLAIAKQRRQQERVANRGDNDDAQGESGQKGNDQDGAFYGGQKPNSKDKEMGFGADGDAPKGDRSGDLFLNVERSDRTQYQVMKNSSAMQVNSAEPSREKGHQLDARQLQSAQRFAAEMGHIEGRQVQLLKRLFEAEAGFHAPQDEPHIIEGVPAW